MRLRSFASPALLVAVAYASLLFATLQPASFNPLALTRMSREFPAERFWDRSPHFVSGTGYDGQFFYYLARDPFLKDGNTAHLDEPGYRYQRLLLPVLAHAFALGQPAAIGWTLIVVNLLALVGGIACFAKLLERLGANPIWLVPYALNPGYWLGIQLDLSEPLALALATAAALARRSRRHGVAAALLAVGVLARETLLLIALTSAAYEFFHGNRRRALIYASPVFPAVAWQVAVFGATGDWAFRAGAGLVHMPFAAPPALVRQLLALIAASAGDLTVAIPLTLYAAAVLVVIGFALFGLAAAFRGGESGWQAASQALLLLSLPAAVWEPSLMSLPRVGAFLFLFLLITALRRRASPAVEPHPAGQRVARALTSAIAGAQS
jgi:hypothetical protein